MASGQRTASSPMPALVVGHGNPRNAFGRNAWTRGWAAIGAALPRPRAVLTVSAHWYLPETAVTAILLTDREAR
jgi:4,5-DOPA dioxygenase extradiol